METSLGTQCGKVYHFHGIATTQQNKAQVFTQLDCHNFTVLRSREIIYADRFIFISENILQLASATYARSFRNDSAKRAGIYCILQTYANYTT